MFAQKKRCKQRQLRCCSDHNTSTFFSLKNSQAQNNREQQTKGKLCYKEVIVFLVVYDKNLNSALGLGSKNEI